jgi:hypothetical protein
MAQRISGSSSTTNTRHAADGCLVTCTLPQVAAAPFALTEVLLVTFHPSKRG